MTEAPALYALLGLHKKIPMQLRWYMCAFCLILHVRCIRGCVLVNFALQSNVMWQDFVRQVEQGSSKVLEAVDWPQSSPNGQKDQEADSRDESPAEDDATGEVWRLSLPCA